MRRQLRRVQASVGAETKRARAASALLEQRDGPGGGRLVDPVARRIGNKDVALFVHRRAGRPLVALAHSLPRLVARDQRVDGAARTGTAAGCGCRGWGTPPG